MRTIANTKTIDRGEWLQLRRRGIGGSDAATVVGLNPYSSLFSLWADKMGQLPEKEDSEAMRQGRDLEQYVAERFCEKTGKKVRRINAMMQHDKHDFMLADIDRAIVGEKAGLECKTTSVMNLKKFKNGEFPEHYYVQCVHYLAVTGWEKWYLAVLILNQGFYIFEIERDEDEIAALIEAEKEFWEKFVVPGTAPPADGLPPTTGALTAIYPKDDGEECMLFCDDLFERLDALKAEKKQFEQEIEKVEQQIKMTLGESCAGYCDNWRVDWKLQERATISKELLLQNYPEIDIGKIQKISNFRRFSVKKINNENKKEE